MQHNGNNLVGFDPAHKEWPFNLWAPQENSTGEAFDGRKRISQLHSEDTRKNLFRRKYGPLEVFRGADQEENEFYYGGFYPN